MNARSSRPRRPRPVPGGKLRQRDASGLRARDDQRESEDQSGAAPNGARARGPCPFYRLNACAGEPTHRWQEVHSRSGFVVSAWPSLGPHRSPRAREPQGCPNANARVHLFGKSRSNAGSTVDGLLADAPNTATASPGSRTTSERSKEGPAITRSIVRQAPSCRSRSDLHPSCGESPSGMRPKASTSGKDSSSNRTTPRPVRRCMYEGQDGRCWQERHAPPSGLARAIARGSAMLAFSPMASRNPFRASLHSASKVIASEGAKGTSTREPSPPTSSRRSGQQSFASWYSPA